MGIKNKETGLTLAEVLVASTIIVFASAAIIQFYISSLFLAEINREETIAIVHLGNMMEAIKRTPFSNITANFPDGASDGINNNYDTIVGGYVLRNELIVVSYPNPNNDPLEINVSTSWQDKRGQNRAKFLVTKMTR